MIASEYLQRLEYDKIVARLAENTAFSAGRQLALALTPSPDPKVVRRRQQETTEAKDLLSRRTDVTIGGAHDVRPLARHAAIEGTLEPRDLLDVRDTLYAARRLRYQILAHEELYPELAEQAYVIQPLTQIIEDISRCLSDDGEVLDSASPALGTIRKQLVAARDHLLERLHHMVTSAQYAQFLQEPIVTERNGRYVIPLRVEFKGRIKGIIHDQSASGQTLFIEPLQTVELNNRWHELQLAERQEVLRILHELSLAVGRASRDIIATVGALAVLDLAFAKARYSSDMHGLAAEPSPTAWPLVTPEATPARPLRPSAHPIYLLKARHPLLDPKTVVPIDVYLGGDFTALLVTGPNTGGKTVSLKTVGLLAAMNQAGLHIPAAEGSRLPVFDGIYADIGDEQSIEQSLSTFSSHLTHIVDILDQASRASLVLLDEVGAGTDPVEGAALAQALVTQLLARGCLTICSTHYSQLKVYAFGTPGVENASVEFDLETLSPTYRLTIGLPGRSNAFAIAAKLGLPDEIISAAQALVAPEAMLNDSLLERVRSAQDAADGALSEAEQARARARRLEADLQAKMAQVDETRRTVLTETRAQGQREIALVRAEIAKLRSRTLRTGVTPAEEIQQVIEVIDRLAEAMEPPEAPPPPMAPVEPAGRPLRVGDTVLVSSLGQTGELVQLSGEEALVAMGGFRLRVPLNGVVFRGSKAPVVTQETRVQRTSVASPGLELDLRGRRAEEALALTERYLSDAYLSGLPWVHIIHGKGYGVLKQVVRELLAGHPLVQSFRTGEISEGGDGITVVKFVGAN
jgi:DNA mismatch repair protein MutS2